MITPFIIDHEGKQYHQYKIEIWPSRDVCGIPGKTDSEGFLQVRYPRRYDSKTYSMTSAEANRISQEKKVFRDAAEFYELLKFKVQENKGKIERGMWEGLRNNPTLFEYPKLDLLMHSSIELLLKMLDLYTGELHTYLYTYRSSLEKIQQLHLLFLRDRWNTSLNAGLRFMVDERQFFEIVNSQVFISMNVPEKIIVSLEFLEPYTIKY